MAVRIVRRIAHVSSLRRIDPLENTFDHSILDLMDELDKIRITRRNFLIAAATLVIAGILGRALPVAPRDDPKKILELLLGAETTLPVYANEIDWKLNESTLDNLPVRVERITNPYAMPIGSSVVVLGGPLAPTDSKMPYNIVKDAYTSDEVRALRGSGGWNVKVIHLDGRRIVNIAGSSRWMTKHAVEFLIGDKSCNADYNKNGRTNLLDLLAGENPLECGINAEIKKEVSGGKVIIEVDVDHAFPVKAYVVYGKEVNEMPCSGSKCIYGIDQQASPITVGILLTDVIDEGKCIYSNRIMKSIVIEAKETQPEKEKQPTQGKQMLDVPYERQKTSWSCGHTSISMITHYWNNKGKGVWVTQDELLEAFPEELVIDDKLKSYLSSRGYDVHPVQPKQQISTIEKLISQEIPALIKLIFPSYMHYVVAVGYDHENVYIHDPARGSNIPYKKDSFPDWAGPVAIVPKQK